MGDWDIQPYHSGTCSLLSQGGRSVFTKETIVFQTQNVVYCSVCGFDGQPSLLSARCVAGGCGSVMRCELGIQVLVQVLTEAGVLQRGCLAVFRSVNVC